MASEDMDSLTFGSTRFLRHLMEPSSRKIPVMEFDVAKVASLMTLVLLACFMSDFFGKEDWIHA